MLRRDNKSSCEREVTLAPGQSLHRGGSMSWVHVVPQTFNWLFLHVNQTDALEGASVLHIERF